MTSLVLGQLILMASPYAPYRTLPCLGQSMSVADNIALLSVLDPTITAGSFKLPTIARPPGLSTQAVGYCICVDGNYPRPSPGQAASRVGLFANAGVPPDPRLRCDGTAIAIGEPIFSELESAWSDALLIGPLNRLPNMQFGVSPFDYFIDILGEVTPVWPKLLSGDEYISQIVLQPVSQPARTFAEYANTTYAEPDSFGGTDQVNIGMVPCDGGSLSLVGSPTQSSPNVALFSLIGTAYGGDGISTFNVPKLSPPAGLFGYAYYIVTQGAFPSQDGGGDYGPGQIG